MLFLFILKIIGCVVGGIIALVLLLLCVFVHVSIVYSGEIDVKIRYLFVPIKLYPRPAHHKKKLKKVKKGNLKSSEKDGDDEEKKKSVFAELLPSGGVLDIIEYLTDMLKIAGKAVRRVFAAIIIKNIGAEIMVANEDAAEAAISYGKVCAVIYPALGVLSGVVKVKNHSINVGVNFLKEKTEVEAEVNLRFRPIRIVWAGLCLLCSFLWYNIKKTAKKSDDSDYFNDVAFVKNKK